MKKLAILLLPLALAACLPASNSDTACRADMQEARARYGPPERTDRYEDASGWTSVRWSWPDHSIRFEWDASMYLTECRVSTYRVD